MSETIVDSRHGHGTNNVGWESPSVVPALHAVRERASTQPGVGSKLGVEGGGFWDSWDPIPEALVVRLQGHLRSTALLGFLRAGSRASPAARRGCPTTSALAHLLMCACLGAMLSDCVCCTLSHGGEAPTQRPKVLPAPLGGQKPVGAQSTVSQARGQKGKGSKLS